MAKVLIYRRKMFRKKYILVVFYQLNTFMLFQLF